MVLPSVGRFAHCKIVQAYCSLLRRYATNSTLTNHCLVKMLHRVAFDCKMPTMLFQLSLFKTLQKILEDPRSKVDASIKVKLLKRNISFFTFQVYIRTIRLFCTGIRQVRRVHCSQIRGRIARQPKDLRRAAVLEDCPRRRRDRRLLRRSARVSFACRCTWKRRELSTTFATGPSRVRALSGRKRKKMNCSGSTRNSKTSTIPVRKWRIFCVRVDRSNGFLCPMCRSPVSGPIRLPVGRSRSKSARRQQLERATFTREKSTERVHR